MRTADVRLRVSNKNLVPHVPRRPTTHPFLAVMSYSSVVPCKHMFQSGSDYRLSRYTKGCGVNKWRPLLAPFVLPHSMVLQTGILPPCWPCYLGMVATIQDAHAGIIGVGPVSQDSVLRLDCCDPKLDNRTTSLCQFYESQTQHA